MAVEKSCCHLEIPKELVAILASVDAQENGCPVWSFSKHNSGYSLKLFWKSEHFKPSPNKAHFASSTTSSKKHNRPRMEAFLAKKKAEVPATTLQQRTNETVTEKIPTTTSYTDAFLAKKTAGVPTTTSQQAASETVKEEIPTAISYADALSTGIGASASRSDKIIQCPSNTSGSLPVPQSSVSAQIYDLRDVSDAVPTRPLSPVASHTRGQMQ